MALSSSEKLPSSGQALQVIKQRLRSFNRWEEVDLGDLFEHAHAAAEVLCDDEVAKDVFIVLSKVGSQYLKAEDIAKRVKGKKELGRDIQSVATVFDRTCRNANRVAPGLFVEECVHLNSGCAASNGLTAGAWKLAPKCNWHKRAPAELLKERTYEILRSRNAITPQELVNMLEEDGFEGLEPFGNLKGDIVVLAVQGPKAVLTDGKIVLNSEATSGGAASISNYKRIRDTNRAPASDSSAGGGQLEAGGAAGKAPAAEQDPEQATVGKERKGRTRCPGSGAAQVPDNMDVGAEETLQKLRQKLAAQGKQHVEAYAADWEMGSSGAKVSRPWFKLPQGRKISTFSEAIKVLENMHATDEGTAVPQSGLEPVHEDTEPCTNDPSGNESAAAKGTKKRPAPAKHKRADAAKRGRTEGTSAAPKSAPLAPARQPLPPSAGRSRKGHYWLDRPAEKAVLLPHHKKSFTEEQKAMGEKWAKSCHACQYQHVVMACMSNKKCEASLCKKCCDGMAFIQDVATDEEWQRYFEGWCPRCLGLCTCRACMRKPHARAAYSGPAHQSEEFARHVLRYVGPLLADQQRDKDAEAVAGPSQLPYVEVHWEDPEDFRHLCDCCATSIADLRRTCATCAETGDGYDLCMHCCSDVRGPDREVLCPLGHPMTLVRFFTDDMVEAVQQTIKMAKEGDKGMWQWRPDSPTGLNKTQAVACAAATTRPKGRSGRQKKRAAWDSTVGAHPSAAAAEQPAAASGPAHLAAAAQPGNTDMPDAAPAAAAEHVSSAAAAADIAALPTSMRTVNPGQKWWYQDVADDCKRVAASRPGGWQNYVFTPHADHLAMFNADRPAQVRLFQEVWREGVPVVVRGVRKGYQWNPITMCRATTENNSRFDGEQKIEVVDCNDWAVESMKQSTFFRLYEQDNEKEIMYKLKDWPPNAHFSERLGRHNQDFMEMLPMPEYSHPKGPLNLLSYLKDNSVKPDLGPKSYVAFGRVKEHEGHGDSVTKLHCDLSDAVNIICHVAGNGAGATIRCGDTPADTATDPSYGRAGAVWDIWPRNSRDQLAAYLRAHAAEFAAEGLNLDPEKILHPIHDQDFFLTAKHRAQLKEEYGVESWHFEQHANEAVFIPAGCPHQVRNLKSCIKVAIDFVSPESAAQCLELTRERRNLTLRENELAAAAGEAPGPAIDRNHMDKLQADLMIARAADFSIAQLH
ncbi:probable lysine-specific demethylase 3A at C-terminar half [Coccomyxa sp. Obi]|nr:probable lysine-specific demethylase 3A at C-terminar half [Coccomyxa sp. Obi]